MSAQIERGPLVRWLVRNGFQQKPAKATGHAHYESPSGHKVTIVAHGPKDLTKKHLGSLKRTLRAAGFDAEKAIEEIRTS